MNDNKAYAVVMVALFLMLGSIGFFDYLKSVDKNNIKIEIVKSCAVQTGPQLDACIAKFNELLDK